MQSRHLSMSIAEYHALPFELGWRCEYYGGMAHYSPRNLPIITLLEVAPRTSNTSCPLRMAQPADAEKLLAIYAAAFGATIEYCDYTEEQLTESARTVLRDHFAGERGNPLSASRVAINPDQPDELIGAILLTTGRDSARLDLLFVHPAWQGRQLATALAVEAVNHLHLYGERQLMSRYHIGNEASRRWHQRFGFRELPDLPSAQLFLRAAQHELKRLEKAGAANLAERQHWEAERMRWQAEVAALKQFASSHGSTAVDASARW